MHGAGHGGGHTLTAIGPAVTIIAGDNLVPAEIGKAGGRKLAATVIDAAKYEAAFTTRVWECGLVLRTDYVAGIVLGTGVFDDVFVWSSG